MHKPRAAKRLIRDGKVPSTFDCRSNWTDPTTNRSVLLSALNQEQCGSCYVFSSTECLQNRLAIVGLNSQLPTVSQQFAMDCSINGDTLQGCQGGDPEAMLQWLSQHWVPTGTSYTAKEESCPGDATGGFIGSTEYTISDTAVTSPSDPAIADIKRDIMVNGPVVAAYSVYEDFMDYWSDGKATDIYTHTTGDFDGGHAVLIIGWGKDYWLVMNSWGTGGPLDDGTFKIAIATNNTGLESNVTAIAVDSAVSVYKKNQWQWNGGHYKPQPPSNSGGNITVLLIVLTVVSVVLLFLFMHFV